ncbi:ferredoxin--NADP+ reductase [Candidatus Kinetoplastibacterium desouzaii TCC079E]|uniref:ferredoxin--NADP(+) reductase n=1 Tax=Candidatus Kinetoplastidibacterium desouzai TCC079E TaxID=1208919 RepID=M1LSB3_9PROT|nr:ferredoxin--NADP reductase [Candidatus Kinetoplastibacterium desouzaii]AGF47026.1 ferredoxin--NADP+ reductase [Candidatus Kinetoplastibacterium desouzaii TCC079E]
MYNPTTNNNYTCQYIKDIKTWEKNKLFSIKTTKDSSFHFKAGQFARVGLLNKKYNDIIWRAYSIASSPKETYLEFYYTVIKNGVFTKQLSELVIGNQILIENKPYGFLSIDQFLANNYDTHNKLWLIATGTGLSAYISILRDKFTWEKFKKIFLVHSTSFSSDLSYGEELKNISANNKNFKYIPITTKENSNTNLQERVTIALENGKLETLAGETIDAECSKVMLCGNPLMLSDMRKLLTNRGFYTSKQNKIGNLALERYWI